MKPSTESLVIESLGTDRAALIREVERLENRIHEACSGYLNRTSVVHLSDQRHGENGVVLGWLLGLDLKDIMLLAAICQAPLDFRGRSDCGKTALAELGLNALFGPSGEQWWRAEISHGMSVDDLLDIDLKQLAKSKLSEAISPAPWLSYPARLLDEINRAPAKLNNILLHIVDGSGLHVRGNLYIPVGLPYTLDGEEKRYSFTIATANQCNEDYDGVFAEDAAMLRRIVLSICLDDIPPSTDDVAQLLRHRRPKIQFPHCSSMTDSVLTVYESLSEAIPVSPLGHLFLHYLSGLGICVRTRSGRLHVERKADTCDGCHLRKAHRYCGRVGGLSEGLLLWTKDIATAIAALRAVKVLHRVRQDCLEESVGQLQLFMDSEATGEKLLEAFRAKYIDALAVTGEDIVAAYSLVAPNHVYCDKHWLAGQENYENSQAYAFADVAATSWASMQAMLRTHKNLFADLAALGELSPGNQTEVEALVTTEDAAMLSVISALRDKELPLKFREAFARPNPSPAAVRVA